MRRPLFLVPLAVSAALLVAVGPGAMASPDAGGAATVKTRHGKLGTFLVDGQGRTLYLFEKDKGKKSTCYDACAGAWPPVTTKGAPKAGGSAKSSLLSTSARRDGSRQVLYKGHPLYRFTPDKKPGDTKGQGVDGFGAEWYVMSPSGRAIE